MKSKSRKLFKIIAPIPCLSAASVPLAITLTSCSSKSTGGLDYLSLNTQAAPTSLKSKNFEKDNTDIVKFLNGDKNYHGGNYCIILASNVSVSSNKWFCNEVDKHSEDYYREYTFAGNFTDAYINAQGYAKTNDCAVLTYFDIQTAENAKTYNTVGEPYHAFDYKWTEQQQKDAEKWDDEHDTDSEKDIKKDHYARNDKSAKDMRDLVKLLHTLFGEPCKEITAEKLPFVMTWKKGIPQKDGFGQLADIGSFHDKVIKTWEKDDEKK